MEIIIIFDLADANFLWFPIKNKILAILLIHIPNLQAISDLYLLILAYLHSKFEFCANTVLRCASYLSAEHFYDLLGYIQSKTYALIVKLLAIINVAEGFEKLILLLFLNTLA